MSGYKLNNVHRCGAAVGTDSCDIYRSAVGFVSISTTLPTNVTQHIHVQRPYAPARASLQTRSHECRRRLRGYEKHRYSELSQGRNGTGRGGYWQS